MTTNKTALVLGATGGVGGEMARLLLARGWDVHAMHRNPERLSTSGRNSALIWHRGDAMSASDVAQAAQGASVIVHAVNPPGYQNWAELAPAMLDNTVAAACANGARIVFPGNVYNFGPDALPHPTESSPQNPLTKKGAIRVEMERRLKAATARGAKVLIVRAGDFFGPNASNNWFAQGIIKAGKPVTVISDPADAGIGHQWAYLPDVAETMMRLLDMQDRLEPFSVFHMDGHWDADGTQMIDAIRGAAGDPQIKVKRAPWWMVWLASPFVPFFREMLEMRYLWKVPVRMDNSRLRKALGEEPRTPLDIAVRTTLIGLGCLPERKLSEATARM